MLVAAVCTCAMWLVPAPLLAQGSLADLVTQSPPSDTIGTEQEWIVRTVVSRMARLASPAASATTTARSLEPVVTVTTLAASPAVFRVVVGDGAPLTLKVVSHIWDPRTYLPVAALLGVRPTTARTSQADGPMIEALTDTALTQLLEQDARVSSALHERPLTPGLHDQAALLLGALALREGAGLYTDSRPALSRLTAHLAIARAMAPAGQPSVAGRLADALLLVEVGREVDALAALAPLAEATQPAAVRAWATALRMRANGDWRAVKTPEAAPPLVRHAYAKAYAWRVGMTPLLGWVDDADVQPDLPLLRIMLSQSFPVAVATQYAASGLVFELAEAEAAARKYDVKVGDATGALQAIGRPDAGGPMRVLDWPLMASTIERHLMGRMKSVFETEQMLGRRERIRQLPIELEKAFGSLPLAPTVLALMGGDAGPRHLAAAANIMRTRKEAVPPALWAALVKEGQRAARSVSWPSADVWFNPWEPDGTALTPDDRLARQGAPRPPLPMVEALHRLAPSQTYLSWRLAHWRLDTGRPTMAAVRAEVGPAAAYDNGAIIRMYRNLDGSHEDYVALATDMCALNVDRCDDLGLELLKEDHHAEAAAQLQRWFDRARDRVAAANGVLWLTRYLFDTGRQSEARAIAASADEVGSAGGINALAELMERQGDTAGAEARYKLIRDRYGVSWHLGAYYLRRWKATGDAAMRDAGRALVAESFPRGFELPPTVGPAPTDGMAFTNFGARAAKAGLRKSDVVVGIDGVRVRSEAQAGVILRASHDATMRFTVWRDEAYTTVETTLPQRWLGCSYQTYRPQAAAVP